MEIPSDSGITLNVQPKMKALEIGEKAREMVLIGSGWSGSGQSRVKSKTNIPEAGPI